MKEIDELNREVIACRKCPRLVAYREKVAREKRRAYKDQEYWGKPVPGFGDTAARIFAVGLAPGAHGSNRTGRQFTGDASGEFLYAALYRAGFASQPQAVSRDDGLVLTDFYTAPVCRCVPPDNKPTAEEMDNCEPFLIRELEIIQPEGIVVLGRIAFERVTAMDPIVEGEKEFAHGAVGRLKSGRWLICSYHPSRQNTQTGRLTQAMFDRVWKMARKKISG